MEIKNSGMSKVLRGRISPPLEGAQDFVDQLRLKFNQILSLRKADRASRFGGFSISQNLFIGGTDGGRRDVTNPLPLTL
jgi:pyruvate-formate lyase